jgi:hypothetical protein
MKCAACSHDNPAGSRFCLDCGRALALACPACGVALPAGARFCNACGAPGRVTGVVAEAGLGKSRLLAELRQAIGSAATCLVPEPLAPAFVESPLVRGARVLARR